MKKLLFLFVITLFLLACSKVTYTVNHQTLTPSSEQEKVYIFSEGQEIPAHWSKVAEFEYKEHWSLEYDFLKTKLIKIAQDKGANVLQVKTLGTGNEGGGAAVKITGSLYKNDSIRDILQLGDSLYKSEFAGNDHCAIIYVSRADGPLSLPMDLYIDNELVCTMKNLEFKRLVLEKEGDFNINFSKDSRWKKPMKFQFGKIYYIRISANISVGPTGVGVGVSVSAPDYIQYEYFAGKHEYGLLKKMIK